MTLSLTTPALLFPAISLLLLAYTNRFLALAALIRELHGRYKTTQDKLILGQLKSLKQRVVLIRNMQWLGVSSFFCCVLCMMLLFAGEEEIAKYVFGASLLLLMASLALSIREIRVSIIALNLQLSDLEELKQKSKGNKGADVK
jgi:hypothetical protein